MITILACYKEDLLKKIKSFNKKAVKWNLPLIELKVIAERVVEERKETPEGFVLDVKYVEVLDIELEGEIPKIDGWVVHSRVEPTDSAQNFVYTSPKFQPEPRLRTIGMVCEHCGHIRRRSLVYLLQNVETGEQKIVGKSCIKDFIPGTNIESLVKYMDEVRSLAQDSEEEFFERGVRQKFVYPVDMLIAETFVLIDKYGYVSRKAAEAYNNAVRETNGEDEYCTVKDATSTMLANTGPYRHTIYSEAEIAAVFQSGKIEKVIEFVNAQDGSKNDFYYNLQLAMGLKYAPPKMFGYVAAGVQQYLKSLEDKAAKEAEAARRGARSNEHVGIVGERLVFKNLKVMRYNAVEGHYGTTHIYAFEDETGNDLVWFSSNAMDWDIGQVVTLKARVKEHGEFRDRKQTVITRATVIE